MKQPESDWGRVSWGGKGGKGWGWVRMPEAAKVVNPVVAEVVECLNSSHAVCIDFVQHTVCAEDGSRSLSIDLVARLRQERWWLELKWTDPLKVVGQTVQDGWAKLAEYQRVLDSPTPWKVHDKLGGGPIARPQRLGVLFVGRHFYSLSWRMTVLPRGFLCERVSFLTF